MTTTTNPIPTVTLSCPPWCTLPAGHGWDSLTDDGHALRIHEQHFSAEDSRHYVAVIADETAPVEPCCDETGCAHPIVTTAPPTTLPAQVSADLAAPMDPQEAMQVAVWLGQAAEAVIAYRHTGGRR